MQCRHLLAGLSFLSLMTPLAVAQSQIYGIDVRLQRFFTSTADANFVNNFSSISPTGALPVFAIDFDETATTLWGINNTTNEYGTFDLTTGVFTPLGLVTITSGTPNAGASGLTCAVDGTWYMSSVVGGNSILYVGDATTGTFAEVGTIVTAGLIIDISINSQGQIYANNISNDTLYSVNPTTGAGTAIGLTGFATNFAQGMDFDWSTDTLYATLYTGGGTGQFATFNLTTGAATSLVATTPLNAEMEIAIKVPTPISTPVAYCTAGTTTSGCTADISASANPSVTAANACNISVTDVEGQKSGLIFYSITGQNAAPWNTTSFLCVKSPTQRTGTQSSGGTVNACDGSFSLDWNAYQAGNPTALGQPWSAGDTVQVQAWFRDPPAGKSTNLSNAIEMTYVP